MWHHRLCEQGGKVEGGEVAHEVEKLRESSEEGGLGENDVGTC